MGKILSRKSSETSTSTKTKPVTTQTEPSTKATQFKLTQANFEQFFADAERNLQKELREKVSTHSKMEQAKSTQDNAALTQRFLQRFIDIGLLGFKSPQDLFNFLKTPAGASLKKIIADYYKASISHSDEALREALKQQQAAFALIAKAMQQEKRKEHLQQGHDNAEQVRKAIKRAGASASTPYAPKPVDMTATYLAITKLIAELEVNLKEKSALIKILDATIAKLEQQKQVMLARHAASNARMVTTFSNIKKILATPGKTTQLLQLAQESQSIEDELQNLEQQIQLLEQASRDEANAAAMEQINYEKENLQWENLHYQAQAGSIKEEFYLLNNRYEVVLSIDEAQYMIRREPKIIEDNGILYYLEPGQIFEYMSSEDKQAAHEKVQDRVGYVPQHVRKLLEDVELRTLENQLEYHNQQKQTYIEETQTIQASIGRLETRQRHLRSNPARTETSDSDFSPLASMPTPKPQRKISSEEQPSYPRNSYASMFTLMQKGHMPTIDDMINFSIMLRDQMGPRNLTHDEIMQRRNQELTRAALFDIFLRHSLLTSGSQPKISSSYQDQAGIINKWTPNPLSITLQPSNLLKSEGSD